MRTTLWQEPLTLNEDVVRKAPGSARAWSNLGMDRYLAGDRDGAIAALEKAIELSGGRDMKDAGRAGLGAWIGTVLGAAAKLSIVFLMVGFFILRQFFE